MKRIAEITTCVMENIKFGEERKKEEERKIKRIFKSLSEACQHPHSSTNNWVTHPPTHKGQREQISFLYADILWGVTSRTTKGGKVQINRSRVTERERRRDWDLNRLPSSLRNGTSPFHSPIPILLLLLLSTCLHRLMSRSQQWSLGLDSPLLALH